MLLTVAPLATLATATCLLISSHTVAAAAHGHYTPARRYAPTEVEPVATAGAAYEEAKGNERRESGGNKIYSVQYCTDPHFTGQCAMPEVTLEDCMVIADPTFMNSISSFRTNDDCVYCELYNDSFCISDLATIYAGSAVADGGVSSKGADFNDIVSSYRCRRVQRGWLAPDCPS